MTHSSMMGPAAMLPNGRSPLPAPNRRISESQTPQTPAASPSFALSVSSPICIKPHLPVALSFLLLLHLIPSQQRPPPRPHRAYTSHRSLSSPLCLPDCIIPRTAHTRPAADRSNPTYANRTEAHKVSTTPSGAAAKSTSSQPAIPTRHPKDPADAMGKIAPSRKVSMGLVHTYQGMLCPEDRMPRSIGTDR